MSEQQFNGSVEQVAAGDIKNFIEAPKIEKEYLSSAQRQALNALVAEVSVECEVEARILWREVVHARVGVERIGEILKEKYLEAQDSLVCYRDNYRREIRTRTLIAELDQAAAERGLAKQLARYCLREFGEQSLAGLSIKQLSQALRYVDEYQPPVPLVAPLSVAGFRMLAVRHPWHFTAVFAVGALLGKVF